MKGVDETDRAGEVCVVWACECALCRGPPLLPFASRVLEYMWPTDPLATLRYPPVVPIAPHVTP